MDNLLSRIDNLKLSSLSVKEPAVIMKNIQLLKDLLEFAPEFKTWEYGVNFDKPFNLVLKCFPGVTSLYNSTNTSAKNPYYISKHVFRVENPFLLAQYYLKKHQVIERNAGTLRLVQEKQYFHGTKGENLEPISTNNFNWRKVKVGKFGKGVSFSPRSDYSKHSTEKFNIIIAPMLKKMLVDKHVTTNIFNAMFACKVLQGKMYEGNYGTRVPMKSFDTTSNGSKGTVFVKYEDFEYYPEYIILMTSARNPNSHYMRYYDSSDDSDDDSDNYYY